MSRTITLIIIAAIVIFIIAAFFGNKEGKKAGKEAAKKIKKMDEIYQDFIERRISLDIIRTETINIDIEKTLREIMIILKPEIDGLIAHINATTYSTAETETDSIYFSNLVAITNSFFIKSRQNQGKTLTSQDEKEYTRAVEDAIKADLQKRMLNLETGNI